MAEGGEVSLDDEKSTDVAEERQVRSGDQKLNLADDFQADVLAVSPSDGTSQFDDATLKAMVEVYLKEGDNKYSKGKTNDAVHFYSKGLQVYCKDIKLNAELYSKRAAAQLLLGNFQEALDDATVSVQLAPTFIEAIEIGASACVEQQLYQEAITWCQKGLAVSFDECRKSQYCFGNSFHLITHVKKRKVGGSHMLLTLINKRIGETGRLCHEDGQ